MRNEKQWPHSIPSTSTALASHKQHKAVGYKTAVTSDLGLVGVGWGKSSGHSVWNVVDFLAMNA